ncbi:nucleotidyltransferase domain-containing protein [Paenibacillus agricola]|uniref:Nucleotidyltransferase AbiEii toxin of type IV toxin-antitoxin system n=1 Tax=Paenibacillus agricola TaxID=2716264 RepID=A0ABX0J3P6_9BACL|nr:hypothetical protein [Paenibacillus agricola]NHN28736.1 hypothetical protein [Paenibacillus agricola]
MHGWEALSIALRQVVVLLKDVKASWLVGGSCGLLLQGVPLTAAPQDLDLYVDSEGAQELHYALSAYSTDQQLEDRTAIYRSILSHYSVAGTNVELVGGFEVNTNGCLYNVEVDFLSEQYSQIYKLFLEDSPATNKHVLRLMPLEHELLFNLLRNRPDRYEAIAAVMRSRSSKISKALEALLERNMFSEAIIQELNKLLLSENRQA